MVYAPPSICPGEWDTETAMGLNTQTDHLILARGAFGGVMVSKLD